jgi:flagellar motility protein MotE (MotC chaperone)
MTSGQIADLLHRLAGANHALAAELKAIAASRRSLSQGTVDRLEHLVEQMRPAAQIRQILAELDPEELLAGAREWHHRRSGSGIGRAGR